MARYQIILAYDGTDFKGFQKQGHARTVQDVFEAALRELDWQDRSILAAGRTDTGVHASGQVVTFDLEWNHSPVDLQRALNAYLPDDVAVREAHKIAPDFHPRYRATFRRYRYSLFCEADRNPLRERFAWRVWPAVEFDVLDQACQCLPGIHDFAAFGTPPRAGGSTTRTVYQVRWHRLPWFDEAPTLVFEISADAFLYHMVRHLVAMLVEIGQGSQEIEVLEQSLQGELASPVQPLAPALGLVLAEVNYSNGESSRINKQKQKLN